MALLVNCRSCGHPFASDAKSCPQCSAPRKSKHSGYWGWFAVFAILFIGLAVNNSDDKIMSHQLDNESSTPHEIDKSVLIVSANQIYSDYKANEINADNKYKGKLLQVNAVVDGIHKDFKDDSYLTLTTDNSYMSIHASINNSELNHAAQLRKGSNVTVECKGGTMILGSPTLNNCIIVSF
ncbi:OB-fold protein [Acinetobacter proteolyticus]|uniref:OB-fold protein n=1 Tax=Acinetobacter proteolyticus TaxID=1776741 RepID=UPI003D97B980